MWNVPLVTSDGHFSVPSRVCVAIKLLQDIHSSDLDPADARSSTASFIQLARPARPSAIGRLHRSYRHCPGIEMYYSL